MWGSFGHVEEFTLQTLRLQRVAGHEQDYKCISINSLINSRISFKNSSHEQRLKSIWTFYWGNCEREGTWVDWFSCVEHRVEINPPVPSRKPSETLFAICLLFDVVWRRLVQMLMPILHSRVHLQQCLKNIFRLLGKKCFHKMPKVTAKWLQCLYRISLGHACAGAGTPTLSLILRHPVG